MAEDQSNEPDSPNNRTFGERQAEEDVGDQFNQPHSPNNRERIQSIIFHIPQLALDQYSELVAAIRFLTVVPVPDPERLFGSQRTQPVRSGFGLGSGYFPFVGLLLALLLSVLVIVLRPFLPQLALSALLVVVLVLLTGGLHLDGLMDSCDALFGGATRERRLEIMSDSRVGSFAVLGGVSALLLKVTFLASLQGRLLIPALLIALPISRWTMVLALRVFPSARAAGLGTAFRQIVISTVISWRLILAGVTALIVALLVGGLVGLVVWVVATAVAVGLGAWMTRRLGGLTGDTYGAIEEVTEVVALLVLVILQTRL